MADPATLAMLAKAAAAVLSSEKARKTIGWVIVAIFSPIIVLLVLLCSLLSGTAEHNTTALELCFHGGVISASVPEDYRGHIENMRDSFFVLDGGAAELDGQMENGDSLDRTRVKAIFYALYFGEEQPSQRAHKQYLDCFVTYEERTRTVTEADDAGNEVEVEETYTVAVPISATSLLSMKTSAPRWERRSPQRIRPTPPKSITVSFAVGQPPPMVLSLTSGAMACLFPTHRSSARMASALPSERAGGVW